MYAGTNQAKRLAFLYANMRIKIKMVSFVKGKKVLFPRPVADCGRNTLTVFLPAPEKFYKFYLFNQ